MLTCFQFQNMNVLQHGESVAQWFEELYDHLADGLPLASEWRLPDWIKNKDPLLLSALALMDKDLLRIYQIYHDCGKPLCRTVDDEGRQHFPNHAEVSSRRFLACSDGSQRAQDIARLIAMDMDIHLLKSEGLAEFASRPEAIALLLTGLCELHSNAQMFGGISSTSFKIKWKQLDRMGKRILDLMRQKASSR